MALSLQLCLRLEQHVHENLLQGKKHLLSELIRRLLLMHGTEHKTESGTGGAWRRETSDWLRRTEGLTLPWKEGLAGRQSRHLHPGGTRGR